MARRSGRVGNWVLPVAAIFLSLTILWAVVTLLAMLIGEGTLGNFLERLIAPIGLLVVVAAAGTLAGLAYLLLAIFQQQTQMSDRGLAEQLDRRRNQLLEQLSEALLLSDRAKAVAYREKERDALRHAINEELAKKDWEAAYHLIDEMQRSFGYHAEAETLRNEVDQRRREAIQAKLSAETVQFRQLLHDHDWQGARAEAARLARRFPGQEQVTSLDHDVDEAREAYKRCLLSDFRQAIDRSEVDRGVNILKELDQYLTPGEAAGLQEAARGVFREKLYRLGVQFSMAVSERNWAEAVKIGEELVEEFPNCRMAEEVRENLPALRSRASQTVPAG